MAEIETKGIDLDRIETDIAAEDFADKLNENKTFFLNGTWGSGKSKFLENAREYSRKMFKEIKLWEIKDGRSVTSLCFRKLFPKIYVISIFLLILGATVTVINSTIVNIDLSKGLEQNSIAIIGSIVIVVLYGVFKTLNIKLDHIYLVLLKLAFVKKAFTFLLRSTVAIMLFFALFCNVSQIFGEKFESLKLFINFTQFTFIPVFFILIIVMSIISDFSDIKETILIIDDFDRVSPERQEEAYMVFNNLNSKMPIVFVGDYSKVAKSEDRYLQKIINTHVDLPYAVHPSNIWDDYFKKLSTEIGIIIPDDFRNIVISEKRNLREREQFNDYITKEFFEKGKVWYLQAEQLLWIIYAFVFHRSYYNKLVDGTKFDLSGAIIANRGYAESSFDGSKGEEVTNKLYPHKLSDEDILIDELDRIQNCDNKRHPRCFKLEKQRYLIYEAPLNLSISELKSIVEDDEKLKEYMLSNVDTDFYQYVSSWKELSLINNEEKLFNITLDLLKEGEYSMCMASVIGKSDKGLRYDSKLKKNEIFESWEPTLSERGFDLSMMFYFFNRLHLLQFADMAKLFSNIDVSKKAMRADQLLHVFIESVDLWGQFDEWDDKIWSAIKSLPDEQFISFWVFQGLFSNISNDFYLIPDNKTIHVYTGKRPSSRPPEAEPDSDYLDYSKTIEKIKPRLIELEKKGYTFNYTRGTYYDGK